MSDFHSVFYSFLLLPRGGGWLAGWADGHTTQPANSQSGPCLWTHIIPTESRGLVVTLTRRSLPQEPRSLRSPHETRLQWTYPSYVSSALFLVHTADLLGPCAVLHCKGVSWLIWDLFAVYKAHCYGNCM